MPTDITGSSRNRPRHRFTTKTGVGGLLSPLQRQPKSTPRRQSLRLTATQRASGSLLPVKDSSLSALTINHDVAFLPNSVKGSSSTEKQLPPKGNTLRGSPSSSQTSLCLGQQLFLLMLQEIYFKEQGDGLAVKRCLLVSKRTCARFPTFTSWVTTAYNSSSRKSNTCLGSEGTCLQAYT